MLGLQADIRRGKGLNDQIERADFLFELENLLLIDTQLLGFNVPCCVGLFFQFGQFFYELFK